jgi:hypothetical protein
MIARRRLAAIVVGARVIPPITPGFLAPFATDGVVVE